MTPEGVARAPFRAHVWLTGGAVLAVAAAAWIWLVTASEDAMTAPAFVTGWLVMMAAMMLPSVVPLVLVYRRSAGAGATTALTAGYLAVWGATGVAAYGLDRVVAGDAAAGLALTAAAAYELTPLKDRFLRVCRDPLGFLMTRWRGGVAGAARLGVEHGAYCLGCCWALMAVLVTAAAMGLGWAALIAGAVFAEKVLPAERFWRFAIAATLLAFAIATMVD